MDTFTVRLVRKLGIIVKWIWFYEIVGETFLVAALNIVFVFQTMDDFVLEKEEARSIHVISLGVLILLETFKL